MTELIDETREQKSLFGVNMGDEATCSKPERNK